MRIQSSTPWIVPSSPPGPCSALKITSGAISRIASTKRASKSSDCAVWPSALRARTTAVPLSIETSRSALGPPITTATFRLDIRLEHHFGSREFSDQVDFELQIDAELFLDRSPHPRQERCDVACRRAAGVDDEVRVEGGHFGPAFAPALGPGGLDQPSGKVALGVAEARAGVGDRDGLVRLAAHQSRLQALADRGRVAALEAQRGARDDRVAGDGGVAVVPGHVDGVRVGFGGGLDDHLTGELADLAVGPGVHADRAADRGGNSG